MHDDDGDEFEDVWLEINFELLVVIGVVVFLLGVLVGKRF
jgi:hypothetical protein